MRSTNSTYVAEQGLLNGSRAVARTRILFVDAAGDSTDGAIALGLRREGWSIGHAGDETVPAGWFRSFRAMVRKIPHYDIVHLRCGAAGEILRSALPLLIVTRFFGKRALVQFTATDIEALLVKYRKYLMPALRLADGIAVGSRFLQKVLSRYGLEPHLLTEPLELEGWQPRTVTKLQPRIVVDCPLTAENDVAAAIRAFRLVKQKYPRAELVIAGYGPERAALAALADSRRLYGVEFVGTVSRRRRRELYAGCDLYLNSSLLDESPASMVRAFAAGLPVVSTDADGLLHMVRHGVSGLVSPAGDHVQLADSIIELVEDPDLTRKLSERGPTEARKYRWSRVRQDWVNMYRSLVS